MSALEHAVGLSAEVATARVTARLRRYVEHESPSHDAERCGSLAEMIAADLRGLGGAVVIHEVPVGKHLVATFGTNGRKPLLIMAHLDTVHPAGTLASQPFTVSDRVTGPGCYDMKAGMTLMIEALAILTARGPLPRPVKVLITCDEEIGSHTSRPLIEAEARGADCVLVPEPSLPNGGVKTMRKGVATYRVTAHGRAAHAGIEPELAVNAITELAQHIIAVRDVADSGTGTSLTVSMINGGTATNVVPAHAVMTIDVRHATAEEGVRVHQELMARTPFHPEARLVVERFESRPPLERTPVILSLYERARTIAAELGVDLPEGGTGGGSDGSLTAALGVPTLDGLGPRGGGAHTSHEHVITADLPFRLAFFTLLLQRL